MQHKTIKITKDTVLGMIGDVHEHPVQFDEIVEEFKPDSNRILVSLGDIYDKGFGEDAARSIIRKIKKLGIHIVLGNHEYKRIRNTIREGKELRDELKWIASQPLSISFKYPDGKSILALHGGVTPSHTFDDLSNSEIVYVRTIDEKGNAIPLKRKIKNGKTIYEPNKLGVSWHEKYDGRFGYICAGHDPQKDGIPKYYKYSCNIDTAIFQTGILTCQLFNHSGLMDYIQAQGEIMCDNKNLPPY